MMGCDLEVDVNGEEVFFVDKEILSSYSGMIKKLISTSPLSPAKKSQKVIFEDFPGGAKAFEVMVRFCYNIGRTPITPLNTCLLHCVAHFMEMRELIKMTQKSLVGIAYWTWSEILNSLEQCQSFSPEANSSGIFDKILDSLVERIVTVSDTSPMDSSPESVGVRFSCDSTSTISKRNSGHRAWWYEDLAVLKIETIKKAIENMIARKLNHVTISRFLFYFLKCEFSKAKSTEKRRATELVIELLYSLDGSCVSCKGLFGILRVSPVLNLSKCGRNHLESMIGSQLDQATLDNLLVPAQTWMDSLYDVNLVLRFLKYFLNTARPPLLISRLKRAAKLIDLYMAEIAPDPYLNMSKFIAVITALPDSARDSHDAIYRAIDMYLQIHTRLSEEEKMNICCAINFEKLSSESCKHLANNTKFPSRTAIQALVSQQSKLKRLFQDGGRYKSGAHGFPRGNKCDDGENIVLYAKKVDISVENEKLKSHLRGMQWKVIELEKVCRKMQSQMEKMNTTKISATKGSRSLPRLCS